MVEPLQFIPKQKWLQLQPSLKLDWPRSVLPINLLETLRQKPELCTTFDFKIYCPYGDVTLGMVATCIKKSIYEVIIHCNHDLKRFIKAIKDSKIIKWNLAVVQFTDRQVMESVAKAMQSRNVEWCHLLSCDTIYLNKELFDIRIPQDVTFKLLSKEHVAQVDSMWEHRHPGSEWYFEQLITFKLGYGLFKKGCNELVAWVFYTESGTFDNLHVLDCYRKKGYGELLAKIAYNTVRKDREYVYTFCVKGNSTALEMFYKLGVKTIGETFWTVLKTKTLSRI